MTASSPDHPPLAAPDRATSTRVYPAMFLAGLCLYALSGVAGLAYAVRTEHRLPPLSPSALGQAESQLARGDLRRGVQQLRMAARLDRADYDTTRRVASILQSAGDPSGQIDQYERARDLKPGDPLAHRLLGAAYYNNHRLDEAYAAFTRASRLDPRDPDAYVGRANIWLDRDRPADAEAVLRLALGLGASNAQTYNILGIALDLQGRRAEAIRAFEDAVRLDPNPAFVQNLDRAKRP